MTTNTLPVVSDTSLSRYLDEVKKFPMLTAEEEFMYAKALQDHGDTEAAHKMITSHMRLVVKIAMGYRGYGLPIADMIAEGNIGLMQAVKKFDPDKGFRLATYAMWWIKASIQEYVLRSWSLVKIGTTSAQKKLFFNLRKMKQQIAGVTNNDLTPDQIQEIAQTLDVSEHEVVEMEQRMSGFDQSLNAYAYDEGESEWIDYVEDDQADQETMIGNMQEVEYKRSLFYNAFEDLNEREQNIVKARQLTEPAKTLEELSQEYDISRERVRQIEARALEKIQEKVQLLLEEQKVKLLPAS